MKFYFVARTDASCDAGIPSPYLLWLSACLPDVVARYTGLRYLHPRQEIVFRSVSD